MDRKKIAGYYFALLPALGALAVVFMYVFVIPVPESPPNQTLRGTEIIFPVFLGVILALVWLVSAFFQSSDARRLYLIWSGLAALPFILLMTYLWVIIPYLM